MKSVANATKIGVNKNGTIMSKLRSGISNMPIGCRA
jgi:hypothetical protein